MKFNLMPKPTFFLVLTLFLFSCSRGITKSRVCSYEANFDALQGCLKNTTEFVDVPETVVFSFVAKEISKNSKVQIQWYHDDAGRFSLVDSLSYYTKVDDELLVSGIDRNFLQPGSYLIKTKIFDFEETHEHEHRFKILSSGKSSAQMLLVGSTVDPNGLVIRPQTYFDQQHARVYLSSYIYDAPANSEIKINFTHIEKGKFSKSFSTNSGTNHKSKFLLYAFLPNKDLPLGEYRVEIVLNNEIFSVPFFIDATQESENEISGETAEE